MEVTRTFNRCLFSSAAIRKGLEIYRSLPCEDLFQITKRTLYTENDHWSFDDDDEFLAAYDSGFVFATYGGYGSAGAEHFEVDAANQATNIVTRVTVGRPRRGEIERVLSVFTEATETALVPEPDHPPAPPPEPVTIFIGHGGSPVWRDLKDHLREQHGYDVEAYETGARAGHTVRDILERMMRRSAFAVLVMTAEDEQAEGGRRARQNVVHEAGLFQGNLGFDRAIVAIEDKVEPFSNLQGIHQLRFGTGGIREIYGDVLATLRREFPNHRP
jgi:hypothetical protein